MRHRLRFDLRPELEIETPRVFASLFDETSGSFGVVMEDLRLRSARFPNALTSTNVSQAQSVLGELAGLHARFWQSPRFARELDWLWTPCSGAFAEFMQRAGREFLRHQVKRSEYKQELLARLGLSFDEAWSHLETAQRIAASEPTTLLHGDTHFGNTYLLPGDRVGLLDWQLMIRGGWSHDVSYLLVAALDRESRRRNERALLAYSLDQLRARGVAAAPSLEDAWLRYRQSAVWGFLIGWMITPVENYGEEILHANRDRLSAALEDLETLAALPH